jgi:predicted enzyme related to lactoylglutathione lyase
MDMNAARISAPWWIGACGRELSIRTSQIFNHGETGIAGLMTLPDATVPPHWQPYVAVDDPDATTAKAKELGGAALMEPMDVPKVGRIAVLRDPQGATFGIIKPDPAS